MWEKVEAKLASRGFYIHTDSLTAAFQRVKVSGELSEQH